MTTPDLFEDMPAPCGAGTSLRRRPQRRAERRPTQIVEHGHAGDDRHYRLAMRAARRLPRSDRRDMTTRLICHHLRCMLDDDELGVRRASV